MTQVVPDGDGFGRDCEAAVRGCGAHQEVPALHARATRLGADQECPVRALEEGPGISADAHLQDHGARTGGRARQSGTGRKNRLRAAKGARGERRSSRGAKRQFASLQSE